MCRAPPAHASLRIDAREHSLQREFMRNPHVVCLRIHSSSASSPAELRFSGSHCSIFRMKRRKHSLSSFLSSSSRVVSLRSSGIDSGIGIPTQKSPEANMWLAKRHNPGAASQKPGSAQLTGIRKELAPQLRPGKKSRRRRPEEGYHLSEMGAAAVRLEFRIAAGEQVLALKGVPDLRVERGVSARARSFKQFRHSPRSPRSICRRCTSTGHPG